MGFMGISEVDCSVGTIVWVQRKNGSWWPGRVVGPNEVSSSHFVQSRVGTPIRLLGRGYANLDWYNLEQSKRVKAFRCGEFDACIEKAESSQANSSKKIMQYALLEDAILHALKLEKQEPWKKRKEPGEEWAETIFRAKRSRCVYLPAESKNYVKQIVPEPLQVSSSRYEMGNFSLHSDQAEENTSSSSAESDSSGSDYQDAEGNKGVTRLSDDYDGQPKNMNCNKHYEVKYLFDFSHNDQDIADVGIQKWKLKHTLNSCSLPKRLGDVVDGKSYVKFRNGTAFDTKSEKSMIGLANSLSQSAPRVGYLEDQGNKCSDPVYIGHHNRMDTTLIDVDLTVQPSYGGENAPLVSLVSRLNGNAIVGHPIDLEASEDGASEILLPKDDDIGHKFDNDRTTMLPQVWKTSKRTPVCYAPHPHPSTFEDDKFAKACLDSGHSSSKGMEKSFSRAQEFPRKPMKMTGRSYQKMKTRASFATEEIPGGKGGDPQSARQICMTDRPLKPKDSLSTVTEVPVKLILSKLLGAIAGQQS